MQKWKMMFVGCALLGMSGAAGASASEPEGARTEVVLGGNSVSYSECAMPYGYAADSDVITLIQSKDVFFRIRGGNGRFYPEVVITHTDSRGMAYTRPVQFSRCHLIKECIDQFSNSRLGVASSCDDKGILRVAFFQL